MLKSLIDPANAITALGLALSVWAITLAVSGQAEFAVAVALWALLADHLDGVIARRTANRSPMAAQIGKSLDSLADLVSAGIFPGVLIVNGTSGAPWAIVVAILLAMASALRLSFFNAVGLEGRSFIGLPTTYALPAVAAVFVLNPYFFSSQLSLILGVSLLIVAVLHVSSLRVPTTRGWMYAVVTTYCISASAVLTLRAFFT